MAEPEAFAAYVGKLKPGLYLFSLSKPGQVRSPAANGWYWSGLRQIADEAGYDDPAELHEIFKAKFLAYKDEKGRLRIRSTSTLTTADFLAYLDKVNRLCLDMFGFAFPLPNTKESEA